MTLRRWNGSHWSVLRRLMQAACCATALLALGHPAFAATKISNPARDPAFVDMEMNSPEEWMPGPNSQRPQLKDTMVQRIRQAVESKPDRLIVLRVTHGRLRWDLLPVELKQRVIALAGNNSSPEDWYERNMASLVLAALRAAREGQSPMPLGVYGLPEENSNDHTNQNYRNVIADVEAVVTSRSLIMSGPAANQAAMLRAAIPQAYQSADGRAIFFRSNQGWKMTFGLDGPLTGTGSSTKLSRGEVNPPQSPGPDPATLIQLAWGGPDSTWDLNNDGVVDVDDMQRLINQWTTYRGGVNAPPPGGGGQAIAHFVNPPATYVVGSGLDLRLDLDAGAPANGNVVFQVWSDAANAVQAAVTDWQAPFVFPASVLNQVTPGGAEIQALVRNSSSHVVAIIRQGAAFVHAPPPEVGTGGNTTVSNGVPGLGVNGVVAEVASQQTGGGGTPGPGPGPAPAPGPGPGNPNAPSPTPLISTLISSGMAPFTAHVHGLNSTEGVGDELTARFEWDFGDPNSQFNTLVGWNAAHLYTQPGSYTIVLRVTNQAGNSAQATTQITVTPDTRTTIYIADTGIDSNNGLSIDAPIRTIARANQLMANNRTFLFRKAGTYQTNTTLQVGNSQNVMIGAYGNGAKPTIWWTTSEQYPNMINLGDQARNIMIQDLEFTSSLSPSNLICRGIGVRGTNVTVRNCKFGKVSYAMTSGGGGVNGWLSQGNTTGTIGAYYAWCEGANHVHIGNTVGGGVDEHNIRMVAQRVLIAQNDLTNTSKSTIWCQIGDHCYVADNKLRKGRFITGPNFANSSPSESFKWVVFEGNEIFDEGVVLYAGSENIILRNNVVRNSGGDCFSIWGYHAPWNHNCKNVFVYNNTAFNSSASYGRFAKVGNDANNIVFANNLYCATALNTQNGAGNIVSDDNNLDTLHFSNNMWALPASGNIVHSLSIGGQTVAQWNAFEHTAGEHFRSFNAGDVDGNLLPLFMAEVGLAVPGVQVDFRGAARPLTGTVTVGAVQLH